MAARLKAHHQEDVRSKIQASQLVNFLQNHALKGGGAKDAKTRIMAARILLDKCLPNLSTLQHTGPDGAPLEVHVHFGEKPGAGGR